MFREAFQTIEWEIAQGAASGIHGIEEVIGSLASLDFINEEYLAAMHKYDPLVTSILIFIFIATIVYCMLFDSKEISKSVQRLILACICLSLFSSLFTFVIEDIGSTTVTSIQEGESTAFGLANSVLNYTVKDYENVDNEYYLDTESWDDVENIDILEELDQDVQVCDDNGQCETIAEKGDYRYEPSLIFSCLIGLGLFIALLFVGVILASSLLELIIAGFIGSFVIAASVIKGAPFGKNYVQYVFRTLLKVILLILVLQSYFKLSNFISGIVSDSSFNIIQEGIVFLMVQCALIMYMFNGSAIIEKVFGMDLGMNKQMSALLASKAVGGLADGGFGGAKKAIGAGTDTLKNATLGGLASKTGGESVGKGLLDGLKQSGLSQDPYRRGKQNEIMNNLNGKNNEGKNNEGKNNLSPSNSPQNKTESGTSTPSNDSNNSLKQNESEGTGQSGSETSGQNNSGITDNRHQNKSKESTPNPFEMKNKSRLSELNTKKSERRRKR